MDAAAAEGDADGGSRDQPAAAAGDAGTAAKPAAAKGSPVAWRKAMAPQEPRLTQVRSWDRKGESGWKKPAHPDSEHARFYDVQGLAVFALNWKSKREAREAEIARRWHLQEEVNAAISKVISLNK